MHNQDTTKDDVMEAVFFILKKLMEQSKKKAKKKENEEEKNQNKELIPETNMDKTKIEENHDKAFGDNEKIERFKEKMSEIVNSDADDRVKEIADTFRKNPIESMKMLQSVLSDQIQHDAKELAKLTNESLKDLGEIKKKINMNEPDALNHIAFLNTLEGKEKRKHDLALSMLLEAKKFNDKDKVNSIEKKKETVSKGNVETMMKDYFENLDPEIKSQYKLIGFDHDNEMNVYNMKFENMNNMREKVLRFDQKTMKLTELNIDLVEEKGKFKKEQTLVKEFEIKPNKDIENGNDNEMER